MELILHMQEGNHVADISIENILKSLDISDIEEKVVALNQSKRHPVVVLVDTSDSMKGYENLLKKIIEGLYNTILFDPVTGNSAELAILSFNSEVKILERMREIKVQEAQEKNLDFHCHGFTLTGLALKNSIMQIEGRKRVYFKNVPNIRYYSPIIFLISDGVAECCDDNMIKLEEEAMRFSKAYIKKKVSENNLIVIPVKIGDHGDDVLMGDLTVLNNDKRIVKVSSEEDMESFFDCVRFILSALARFKNKIKGC